MPLKISQRSEVPPFRALDTLRLVNERIATGEDIKRLEAGQPCFGAPQAALDYVVDVLKQDPRQGYTEALGITKLRRRVAELYKQRYDLDLDYNRVALTFGSSGGFLLSFLSVFDVGDKVAMAAPGYPAYRNFLRALGLQPIEFETSADTDYQPTVEILDAIEEKIDGLIICSPANPTGTMISPDNLKAIAQWCEAHGVRLISDEVYHGLTYDEDAETVLKSSDSAIVLGSFSKYFAMTGWRLGWLVLPENVVDPVKRLAENLFVSPPTPAQHLAWKIFDHQDELEGYKDVYRANREAMLRGLPEAGFTGLSKAKGAFYFYVDVHTMTNDSIEFCNRMMNEAKVSATPGVDFDTRRGSGTIRISYAGATEDIEEACRRLQAWQK